jgi:quercetin dioxygenase-like cupin family protein
MLIRPDEGERVPRGDRHHRVLAEEPELEAFELRFGPDFVVEPHSHGDHVDSFYVLDGDVEFTLGAERIPAGPGTWFAAPVGTVHGFRTLTEVRMLNVHGPNTGFGERLRQG